ncbi:MAG: hypothetical protein KGL13_08310 [Gammaproteobacteria bacterium]|nr:hypothetical protein [Gammaproteobacteria bacterium]
MHGVVSTTDARGRAVIHADSPQHLQRYRFGLGITDFLLCVECGIYVAAVLQIKGMGYASINANVLEVRHLLQQPAQAVDYSGENMSQRLARREKNWTPAVFPGVPA